MQAANNVHTYIYMYMCTFEGTPYHSDSRIKIFVTKSLSGTFLFSFCARVRARVRACVG